MIHGLEHTIKWMSLGISFIHHIYDVGNVLSIPDGFSHRGDKLD